MYRGKQKKLENLAERKPNNTYTSKPGFLQQHSIKIVIYTSYRNKNLIILKIKS